MRLGFPDRVYGLPTAGAASLGAQWAHLRDVFCYLESRRIRMYRLSTRLVDALAEEWPDGIAIHRGEIDLLATACAAQGLRLSFHPHSAVALGALEGAAAPIVRT